MTAPTRTRTSRPMRTVPAAALGVALLAAGCGQAASAGVAAAPASLVVRVGSAATPAAATVTPAELATRVATALRGVYAGTAVVTVAGQGRATGAATVAADATAHTAQVVATVQGQRYQVRVVGGNVFVTGPALAPLTGGKTWGEVSAATLAKAGATARARATASPTPVPQASQVATLLGAALSVRDLGPAKVAGTLGHAYRVSLPVAVLASAATVPGLPLSQAQRQQVTQGVDALARQGVTTLSAELVLDARNRPLELATTTPAVAGGVSATRVTAVFRSWGSPVRVSAPPAADVAPLDARVLAAVQQMATGATTGS